jgi:hypothetical protein
LTHPPEHPTQQVTFCHLPPLKGAFGLSTGLPSSSVCAAAGLNPPAKAAEAAVHAINPRLEMFVCNIFSLRFLFLEWEATPLLPIIKANCLPKHIFFNDK